MSLQNRLTALAQAVGADIKDLRTKYTSATTKLDTVHIVGATNEPAFKNSWTNANAAVYGGLRFRKDPFGVVRVQGVVTGGANNSVVFTLPVGYRPNTQKVLDNLQSSATAGTYVTVDTNGDIKPVFTAGPAFLDFSFDTETVTDLSILATNITTANSKLENWHIVGAVGEPGFTSNWSNFDTTRTLRFRKDPFGKVSMAGFIKGGATATAAFTLPEGYRPNLSTNLPLQLTIDAAGGNASCQIWPDGRVFISNADTSTTVTTWATVDGVEFWTDTVTDFSVITNGVFTSPQMRADRWHYVGGNGEPSFNAGWSNLGSGERELSFQKNPFGKVSLSGIVNSPNVALGAENVAFTLPVGYRPVKVMRYAQVGLGGPVSVRILPNGSVTKYGFEGYSGGAGWLDFAGIEFDTETVTDFAILAQGLGGGVGSTVTLNWNTALTTGFYRSYQDPIGISQDRTINGPGDTLNPPPQVGIVMAHDSGMITQRVWDLSTKRAYTRFMSAVGDWSTWAADLTKPDVVPDQQLGGPTPQDGDERYFQNSTMKALGYMWKFRYDASAPAGKPKWVFVGGIEHREMSATGLLVTTGNGAYVWSGAMTTPKYTLPLSGDYHVGFNLSAQGGPIGDLRVAMFINGNYVSNGEGFQSLNINGNFSANAKINDASAGQVLDLRSAASVASAQFNSYIRTLTITPIRCYL